KHGLSRLYRPEPTHVSTPWIFAVLYYFHPLPPLRSGARDFDRRRPHRYAGRRTRALAEPEDRAGRVSRSHRRQAALVFLVCVIGAEPENQLVACHAGAKPRHHSV